MEYVFSKVACVQIISSFFDKGNFFFFKNGNTIKIIL